jgi:hypothetical protein
MKTSVSVDLLRTHNVIPKNDQQKLPVERSPLDEARDLYRMVSSGFYSLEAARDLIAVPHQIKDALRDYAERFPKDGDEIQVILRFRQRVAEEFEKLVEGNQLS